jgi:hypothetical protein
VSVEQGQCMLQECFDVVQEVVPTFTARCEPVIGQVLANMNEPTLDDAEELLSFLLPLHIAPKTGKKLTAASQTKVLGLRTSSRYQRC